MWLCTEGDCNTANGGEACIACGATRPANVLRLLRSPPKTNAPASYGVVRLLEETLVLARAGKIDVLVMVYAGDSGKALTARHSQPMDAIYGLGLVDWAKQVFLTELGPATRI